MFASTFLSRLTNSTSQPLLPVSSPSSAVHTPYTDAPVPSTSDGSATLLALARQEAYLQSHIQYLLDIQSDRLLEGLGEKPSPSHIPPPSKASPSRHAQLSAGREGEEAPPPPSLHITRTSITSTIASLASIKASTTSILTSALTSTTTSLSHISSLRSRKSALRSTISELETSLSSSSLEALSHEEEALGHEIYELENRLFEMKARRRVLRQKVEEGRNRRDARVSSWRRSLEMVEGEEEAFVKTKPESLAISKGGESGGAGDTVWDLPPKRRTLDMVNEYYRTEESHLKDKLAGVEREREALEEGGEAWESVVRDVDDVESLLRREMNALNEPGGASGDDATGQEGMHTVLRAMKQVRARIEQAVREAEAKGWNLLVVAAGAELEALVEGEGVLRGVLGMSGGSGVDQGAGEGEDGGEGLVDLGEVDGNARVFAERETNGTMTEETDDDDDEPGPELLMSAQEEDTGRLRI